MIGHRPYRRPGLTGMSCDWPPPFTGDQQGCADWPPPFQTAGINEGVLYLLAFHTSFPRNLPRKDPGFRRGSQGSELRALVSSQRVVLIAMVSPRRLEFMITACRFLTHLRIICGQHRCKPSCQEARLCRTRAGCVIGYLSVSYSEKTPNWTRKDSKEGFSL